jgi:radical SAM superfamily enzyme YgiQ (UPF0313 family)
MANVLLIYPAPDRFKKRRFGFSLDLLYISSLLKQAGHNIVNYLDYSIEPFSLETFRQYVDKADAVILELDSFPLKRAINIRHGQHLTDLVKKSQHGSKKEKKVILFGSDISLVKGDYPDISSDYALGKGYESNIAAVIEALLNGKPVPPIQPITDLDRLPLPDRSLLTDYAEHGGSIDSEPKLEKSTLVRTSAGCLNTCVFCQRKGWQQKYLAHSVPYVLKEFSQLAMDNYRNVWVIDDNFTYDLKRSKQLLEEIAVRESTANMRLALSSWTLIDKEFLELAHRANVSIISFGVESANKEIQKFYRKSIRLEPFRELIAFADHIGLYTVGNFIIGAPMETETTIAETFAYIIDTPFDQVNIKILDYMAGSRLYEDLPPEQKHPDRHIFACKENGLNDFPMEVLKSKISDFMKDFRESRESRFKEKIKQKGPPYFLKEY